MGQRKVIIEVRIEDDKVATGIKTDGYREGEVGDQLELLGIMENIKGIIQERIKKLADVSLKM